MFFCLLCSVCVLSCVPAVFQQTAQAPREEEVGKKTELLKPKMAESSDSDSSSQGVGAKSRNSNSGQNMSQADQAPPEIAGSSRAETKGRQAPASEERETEQFKGGESAGNSQSDTSAISGPARRIAASSENPTTEGSAGGNADPPTEPKEQPFKRHDHAKYIAVIKNKGIDLVNSQKTCDQAIICKDSMTEQWTLTLYYKKAKTYIFNTYVWDEIDGKWQKSFESGKRPISGWEKHLKYTSSGKDCQTLKKARR